MIKQLLGWCLVLTGLCGGACSTESAIQKALGVRASSPVFLGYKAVSPAEIDFQFSLPVEVSSMVFDPTLDVKSVTGGTMVQIYLNRPAAAGERITANLLVEDEGGNTLDVLIPFRARNDRLPSFTITELRTDYSKPKAEFVEIKTKTPGNLGALRLFSASAGMDAPIWEFPPVEVGGNEYIVIHLRSIEEGIVNETGTDLAASGGTDALPTARDFWVPGAAKLLHKTGAVFFLDQDDQILDGVLLCEDDAGWSKKEFMGTVVELLSSQGAWIGTEGGVPGPQDAVVSKGATATRSISRKEALPDTNSKADWYITATSKASPGKPNNPEVYVPK
ncbi:hypothetical protein LQZ21_07815 [Treponema sp. TIM-1]|uniref:hypothetical protein n=1 Tax=Treponema sp. TIM-1 TaxID=2898417 RepID=UPI0039811923